MADRIPLIAGNWKLNQDHLQAIALVQKLAWTLQDGKHDHSQVEVAVFPPFTDLRSVQTLISAERFELRFGAQDVSQHDSGAHTGEVSAAMLAKLECSYAIVGHSERRQDHGETDALIGKKAAAAMRHGVTPVICVGETAEDLEQHGASAVPVQQLRDVLAELPEAGEIVVAYEPVWAIGSGQACHERAGAAGVPGAAAGARRGARRRGCGGDPDPVRRQRQVGQHRRLHARGRHRRRPRGRREPRRGGVRGDRPLPPARRYLTSAAAGKTCGRMDVALRTALFGRARIRKESPVEILQIIMQVILGITSVLLTLFILLHKGRGGGLSDMFGGGVGSSIGSSGVAERNLNTITVVVSLAWVASIVVLGLITKFASL